MQRYVNSVLNYHAANEYHSTTNSGDITFYNSGYNWVQINNGLRLYPGHAITIECNQGEEDTTKYSWQFEVPDQSYRNSLTIIVKKYI